MLDLNNGECQVDMRRWYTTIYNSQDNSLMTSSCQGKLFILNSITKGLNNTFREYSNGPHSHYIVMDGVIWHHYGITMVSSCDYYKNYI